MMKRLLPAIFLLFAQTVIGQPLFQLAPPMLKYNSAFFAKKATVTMVFNQPGAEIRYTLNGNEPTATDLLYTHPITISKEVTIKAKAVGNDFLPSATVTASFIKDGKPVQSISFSKPNDNYITKNNALLHDNIGGLLKYNTGTWLGYDTDTAEMVIRLKKKTKINTVLLELLQDENSWIFLPRQIELFSFDEKTNTYTSVAKEIIDTKAASPKQASLRRLSPNKKTKTNQLKIVMHAVEKIPDWHAGKGSHAWLFIDEIKVY